MVPSPNWPLLLLPQHLTPPLLVRHSSDRLPQQWRPRRWSANDIDWRAATDVGAVAQLTIGIMPQHLTPPALVGTRNDPPQINIGKRPALGVGLGRWHRQRKDSHRYT
ncbi:hypothetical protein KFU94_36670 [Chloroflexi bacterium TSY]|nr:hypothetical protein [Chloroflexi bacterium TSY]